MRWRKMTSFSKSWYTVFSFSGWIAYSKLDRVKMMGTRGKINATWWNMKINNYVDMNCQQICKNFMQKDLTKVRIFPKVLGRLLFWNTLYTDTITLSDKTHNSVALRLSIETLRRFLHVVVTKDLSMSNGLLSSSF